MKLEVGMYVRGKYYGYRGKIGKIIKNYNNDLEIAYTNGVLKTTVGSFLDDNTDINGRQYVASFDIIDLIEVGDYANGYYVSKIWKENEVTHYVNKTPIKRKERQITIQAPSYGGIIHLKNEDIKSIVTKEQFEQMSYKIGDDK